MEITQVCRGCQELRVCDPALQLCADCEVISEINSTEKEAWGKEAEQIKFKPRKVFSVEDYIQHLEQDDCEINESDYRYHGDNYTGE